MANIDTSFLRLAVLYILVGMGLGLWMGISGDHGMYPAHAHINLVGWTSSAVFGLVYRAYPAAARSPLAPWHFWLSAIGGLVLVVGIVVILAGHHELAPIAGVLQEEDGSEIW